MNTILCVCAPVYNIIHYSCPTSALVLEPDPRKNRKGVWEKGWGGSVHCARNAGALPIGSWLYANVHLLKIQTANR